MLDGVTVTAVSELTLEGANVTLAAESVLEMVPPVVDEMTVGGGESPLAVFAVGSGVVVVSPVAGGFVAPDEELWVVWEPTSTVIVPVPVPVPVAGGVAVVAGSGVVVEAAAFELPDAVLVSGTVVPVLFAGTVTFCDPLPDEPDVSAVVVPLVVVAGTLRFGSVGASWLLETGGAAEVSVGGVVDVVFVVVFEFDVVFEAAVETDVFNCALSWARAAATAADAWSSVGCAAEASDAPDGDAASFGGGIGTGLVSGTVMAGSATPVESSKVGSAGVFPAPGLG